MSGFWLASYIVLWVLFLAVSFALLSVFQHFGRMYAESREGRDAQGPPVGSFITPFRAAGLDGELVRLPLDSERALVLFFSTDCKICAAIKSIALPAVRHAHPGVAAYVVCGGAIEDVRGWASDVPDGVTVVADPGFKIAARNRVAVTPFCVAVTADGAVSWRGIASTEAGLAHAASTTQPVDRQDDVLPLTTVDGRPREELST